MSWPPPRTHAPAPRLRVTPAACLPLSRSAADAPRAQFDSDEDDDEDDEEGQEGEDDDDDDEFEEGMEGMDDDAMVDDGDDDDDDDAEPEADDDDEAAQAPTKESKQKATVQQVEVTAELVREWQRKLSKGAENGAALKQLISAFRCAVHYGDEDDDEGAQEFAYSFTSGHVFNMLVQFCLQRMDGLLRRHCAGSEADAKKGAPRSKGAGAIERVDQWPHWRRHQLSTRSYLTQAAHFLAKLSEPEMTLAVLQQVHRLLPFYVALPKLVPKLFRTLVKIWSGGTGGNKDTCLLAFACIRQLAAEMPAPFIDTALKACYLAFAQMCAPRPRAPPRAPSRALARPRAHARPRPRRRPRRRAEMTTFCTGH